MNYTKKFIVKPGSKVRLKEFDPAYHGKGEPPQDADRELTALQRLRL